MQLSDSITIKLDTNSIRNAEAAWSVGQPPLQAVTFFQSQRGLIE